MKVRARPATSEVHNPEVHKSLMGSRKESMAEEQQNSEGSARGTSRHRRAGQIMQAVAHASKECGFHSKVTDFIHLCNFLNKELGVMLRPESLDFCSARFI